MDALVTARYIREHLKQPDRPVIYWERSLGSYAAAFAAAQMTSDGLILELAFAKKRLF